MLKGAFASMPLLLLLGHLALAEELVPATHDVAWNSTWPAMSGIGRALALDVDENLQDDAVVLTGAGELLLLYAPGVMSAVSTIPDVIASSPADEEPTNDFDVVRRASSSDPELVVVNARGLETRSWDLGSGAWTGSVVSTNPAWLDARTVRSGLGNGAGDTYFFGVQASGQDVIAMVAQPGGTLFSIVTWSVGEQVLDIAPLRWTSSPGMDLAVLSESALSVYDSATGLLLHQEPVSTPQALCTLDLGLVDLLLWADKTSTRTCDLRAMTSFDSAPQADMIHTPLIAGMTAGSSNSDDGVVVLNFNDRAAYGLHFNTSADYFEPYRAPGVSEEGEFFLRDSPAPGLGMLTPKTVPVLGSFYSSTAEDLLICDERSSRVYLYESPMLPGSNAVQGLTYPDNVTRYDPDLTINDPQQAFDMVVHYQESIWISDPMRRFEVRIYYQEDDDMDVLTSAADLHMIAPTPAAGTNNWHIPLTLKDYMQGSAGMSWHRFDTLFYFTVQPVIVDPAGKVTWRARASTTAFFGDNPDFGGDNIDYLLDSDFTVATTEQEIMGFCGYYDPWINPSTGEILGWVTRAALVGCGISRVGGFCEGKRPPNLHGDGG